MRKALAELGALRPLRAALARPVDVCLAAGAVLLMLPTCWYRYGIDQALYHYFGTGWIDGLIPYKDAFDIKPPGIYALYAIVTTCLGRNQAAIRIAEIGCVLAVGFLAGESTEDGARTDGVGGACALLLAAWHTTLFGFWDTGQAELWQGASIVAAYSCVRGRTDGLRLGAGGALAAMGILFKATAVLSVVVLAGVVLLTGGRTRSAVLSAASVRRLSCFAAGFVAPIASTLLYFAAKGAWPALVEWARYLRHYAAAPLDAEWVGVIGPEMLLARCGAWLGVFGAVITLGFVRATDARGRRPFAEVALLGSAVAGIVWQRRYFSYHPALLGPFLVLAAAAGIRRAVLSARPAAVAGVVFLCAGAFWSSPPWTGNERTNFRVYVLHGWWPYVTGRLTESAYSALFDGPFDYSYAAHTELAALIESRKPRRTDKLHIRGFDPTTYVLCGLYSPSRFMMETPLENPYLAAFQPQWPLEHWRRLFVEARPRFFVTEVGRTSDLVELERAGFGLVGSRSRYVLLERGLRQSRLEPEEVTRLLSSSRSARGTLLGSVPFTATFGGERALELDASGNVTRATWHVTPNGEACLTLATETGPRERCGTIYTLDGGYAVFAEDGSELAKLMIDREP